MIPVPGQLYKRTTAIKCAMWSTYDASDNHVVALEQSSVGTYEQHDVVMVLASVKSKWRYGNSSYHIMTMSTNGRIGWTIFYSINWVWVR